MSNFFKNYGINSTKFANMFKALRNRGVSNQVAFEAAWQAIKERPKSLYAFGSEYHNDINKWADHIVNKSFKNPLYKNAPKARTFDEYRKATFNYNQRPGYTKWLKEGRDEGKDFINKIIRKENLGEPIVMNQSADNGVTYARRGLKLIPKFQNAGILGNTYVAPQDNIKTKTVRVNFPQQKAKKPVINSGNLDIYHRFSQKNFEEFVSVMYPIFEQALMKGGYPTTNIQNLIRQAALESGYGTQPRGKRGYNLGGIKWFNSPSSGTYKYKHTTGPDGQEYIDFDSLQDYADYKVKLLNDVYNALDAKDTNDFVNRLHGDNPSKKSYSASKHTYIINLNGTKSLDRAYNNYLKNRK